MSSTRPVFHTVKPRVVIDFETHSELDLNDVGPVVYSKHPSTYIMCLSWYTGNEKGIWVPTDQLPAGMVPLRSLFNVPALNRLFKKIEDGWLVEAHNAMFERCIWENIGQDRMFWPIIDAAQWRCSASRAAACAFPRALEDAAIALRLTKVKDMTGHRTMRELSKPPKITRKYKPPTVDKYDEVYAYCENDTVVEFELSENLPELTPYELRVWQVDQRMNLRGIPVDVDGAKRAVWLAETWTAILNDELHKLTNGEVEKATQRERLLAWLERSENVALYDSQALTLDSALKSDILTPKARRAIEIVRSIGRSSVSKYQTLVETAHEGRLHDTQMYHGATTGRWTARRFQPQNLPRGIFKTDADIDAAWYSIHNDDLELIRLLWGDPMQFLSNALRGAVIASFGKLLYCADYSAVETRVLFWLAYEQKGLDVFRTGADIYIDMASDIYGRKYDDVTKDQREVGKRAVLGLGFNMGYVKFLMTCRGYGIKFTTSQILEIMTKEQLRETAEYINTKDWDRCAAAGMTLEDLPELALMNFIVRRYRKRYEHTVCKMWKKFEDCAKAAVLNPGRDFTSNRITYHYDGERFLTAQLPSGRKLFYPFPELIDGKLHYMTTDAQTHQWVYESTYGGKLTENNVQAVARDLMACALVRLDESGTYEPVMTVHDEIVSESATGNVKEYEELVARTPIWAMDLPLKAEGWTGPRYRK